MTNENIPPFPWKESQDGTVVLTPELLLAHGSQILVEIVQRRVASITMPSDMNIILKCPAYLPSNMQDYVDDYPRTYYPAELRTNDFPRTGAEAFEPPFNLGAIKEYITNLRVLPSYKLYTFEVPEHGEPWGVFDFIDGVSIAELLRHAGFQGEITITANETELNPESDLAQSLGIIHRNFSDDSFDETHSHDDRLRFKMPIDGIQLSDGSEYTTVYSRKGSALNPSQVTFVQTKAAGQ
jgi:hypothetical protein